jgi:hypothetical protein
MRENDRAKRIAFDARASEPDAEGKDGEGR